jgi:hypothetical protein
MSGTGTGTGRVQTTPRSQRSGSSFASHLPLGFGYLPMSCQFDPTFENQLSLSQRFVPSLVEINTARPAFLYAENPGFQPKPQGKESTCRAMWALMDTLADMSIGKIGFYENFKSTLKAHNLSLGIATEQSRHGFDINIDPDLLLALMEVKGSDVSILQVVSQAAAVATNFCIGLYNRGIPREHCIVPVVAYNGLSIFFGATILLDATFPTFVPLSKVLYLGVEYDSQVASAFIFKILHHSHFISTLTMEVVVPTKSMDLMVSNYFVKRITQAVFDRGFGLFTASWERGDIENGLYHMIRCLNRIYNSPARNVAEYPLSVRTPASFVDYHDTTVEDSDYEIIFNDLSKQGFAAGVPNRIVNPQLYDIFLTELLRVMSLIHDAGVIHVDLYASNVMWKEEHDRSVTLKIVGWETSHSLLEGAFAPQVARRLASGMHSGVPVTFGVVYDMYFLNVYRQQVGKNESLWLDMCTSETRKIDCAFAALLQESVS